MTMSTNVTSATDFTSATNERFRRLRGRLRAVPWLTVLPLAVVMAYADGFWMVSLRGAVGSIERTQEPFANWLRESTLSLPFFVLAVIGALMLAARLFGPVLRSTKVVVATALLVVAAGTLVGIYEVATSSAYDYQLQSSQLNVMGSMRSTSHTGATSVLADQRRASLALQLKSVAYGSGILLATNVVFVGWVLAFRGGRLNVRSPRH
jgi:hypothetical protein